MHVFELYEKIRSKPGMFIYGEKSLRLLGAYMHGFLAGVGYQADGKWEQAKLTGHKDLRKFNSWVAKELGLSKTTMGCENLIFSKVPSDEQAFDVFFQLLDKYRKAHPDTD
jgi:hypothetical protein